MKHHLLDDDSDDENIDDNFEKAGTKSNETGLDSR